MTCQPMRVICIKIVYQLGCVYNETAIMISHADPDEMPDSVASDLSLHCLTRPICPNFMTNMI